MSSTRPLLALAFVVAAISLAAPGFAASGTYAQMAPFSQYLMSDRAAEIALARTAAPAAITQNATILVLGRHGYETAVTGSNGFTCLVERSWMSAFDDSGFWNWNNRSPICYNPAASRTVLLYTLGRTKMVVSGLSKSQMLDRITAQVASKQLPAPELGSMSYMMSKEQRIGTNAVQWLSHLMFYAPKDARAQDGASWGANLPKSPVVFDSSSHVVPEPETIFMVPLARWSDGSLAPKT